MKLSKLIPLILNMSETIGIVKNKVISNKTTNFFFEPNLNLIYFQPDLSNIRIASSLFDPNKFRSKSSILNSPHSLTISLGLIEGFTEYSYVLLTYVFWASSDCKYLINLIAFSLFFEFFVNATPETLIWAPLWSSPWLGN